MKCIYCLEDKSDDHFTSAEHVIPQSFGLFRNNFVLNTLDNNKTVCNSCNDYFGKSLEIDLARDSFEGTTRVEHKIKKPSEFKTLGKRSRLIIKTLEGPFKGCYAYREYSQQENKVLLKPFPQVGFLKRNSNEYEYFLLDQIPRRDSSIETKYNLNDSEGIIILGCDPTIGDDFLKNKGFTLKIKGVQEPPSKQDGNWLCEVEGKIDQKIFRAIAKIAFNYLAYFEGTKFVMHGDFDPIRKFIRIGEKADYPLIRVVNEAILADEKDSDRRRLGHIVTANWADDKASIIAQVSLFNWAKYYVSLARNFSGERRSITRGHFFNTYSQEIMEMGVEKKA